MVVRDDVGDDRFLVGSFDVDVLRVEQSDQSEFAFSQIEGVVQVVHGVGL